MKVVEGTWKLKNGKNVYIQKNGMGELMALVEGGSFLYYSESGECVREKKCSGRIFLRPSLLEDAIDFCFFETWDLEELIEAKEEEKIESIKRNSNPILSLDLYTE